MCDLNASENRANFFRLQIQIAPECLYQFLKDIMVYLQITASQTPNYTQWGQDGFFIS
jgi:hypothetical protein